MRTPRFAALAFLAALMLAALAPQTRAELIGYWTFDAGTGADASAYANNGTVGASVTLLPGGGWNGSGAIQTPGANVGGGAGVVTVPNSASLASINSGLTLSYWMNAPLPTNPNQWGRIFEHGTEVDGTHSWMVNQNGGNNDANVRVDTNPGGQHNQNIAVGGPTVYDSTWHHTVFTLNNGTWQKFVDGVSSTGAYNAGTGLGNAQPLYMGGAGGNSQYGGKIDDVALWNGPISPIDLGKLVNNTITPLQVSDAKATSYKIVAYNGDGTAAGNTTFSAYLSEFRGGVGSTGTQFATGTGTNTASAAGILPIRLASSNNPSDPGYAPDRLHIQSTLNFGTPDPTQLDPRYYLAAQLTAPPGYVFEFLSGASTMKSQYFTSLGRSVANPPGTGWTASPDSWEDQPPTGVNTNPYAVPVSSSNLAGGPWTAATQGVWARQNANNVYNNVYFDAPLRLIPGIWDAVGTPLASINTPAGISAQLARTTSTSNLTTLDQAMTALSLRPGNAGHYMSEVTSISTARIQDAGYGTPDRVLAGYHETADGLPLNTGVKLAGYVYIDPTWPDADPSTPGWQYVRSFAVGANDGARVWIGDTQIADNSGSVSGSISHTAVPLTFHDPGYWPITVQWFQNNGTDANMGLAISSRDGNFTTWDSTNFKVLGDLSGVNPLQVYQRPTGVDSATGTGPNSVGNTLGNYPSLPPVVDPTQTGLRVQQAFVAGPSLGGAVAYFSDKTIANGNTTNYNIGSVAVRQNLDMTDPQNPSAGNWAFNNPFPNNTAIDDNNFVTRINGVVYIPSAGNYAFSCGSDESFQLRVGAIQLGKYDGTRTMPSGQANIMYGSFPAAGFYPLEFYSHEATGASGIELANGGFGVGRIQSQFLSSNNPNTAGFSVDWSTNAFAVEPVGLLRRDSTGVVLEAKAFANVPALGIAIPVESWRLYQKLANVPRVAGLVGQLVATNTNTVIANKIFTTSANGRFEFMGDGYGAVPAFGFEPPTVQHDNIKATWTGVIDIPATNSYHFEMHTDDVSWMFIDIDGDYDIPGSPGYHVFETGESSPQNGAWNIAWDGVALSAGPHRIMLQAQEFGGGEYTQFQWSSPSLPLEEVPMTAFAQGPYGDMWALLNSGVFTSVGDLSSWGAMMTFPMDWNTEYTLRLQVDVAGLTAMFDGTFTFMPEPTSLVLLGGGLLALARRRRKTAR